MAQTELKPYEERFYFAAAPTYNQAKRIYWRDLKALTRNWWAQRPSESDKIIFLRGAKDRSPAEIHVFGMDKPERIEGTPWDGGILDEYGNMKPGAWSENVRPGLSDRLGWAWLIGVPEGRNHYYEFALDACGGSIPVIQPGVGVSAVHHDTGFYSWHSADILPSSEVEAARRQLDEKTFKQEYEGSFEGMEGLAYYLFGPENIDNDIQHIPGEMVYIGMDFNVDPMTATFNHVKNIGGEQVKLQFGEAYLRNSNTFEMVEHLREVFGLSADNERKLRNIRIFPDSTGKHESSNARRSDLNILRDAGFEIFARPAPPRVKDRVNAYNSRLRSAAGVIRAKLNAEACPYTLRDLNRVERLPDGRLNKAQEAAGLKHITDADGYFVDYVWPVSRYDDRQEIGRAG